MEGYYYSVNQKFQWRINKFSKLDSKELFSDKFLLCGFPWRILIYPKGNNVEYLSIYLELQSSNSRVFNLHKDWSRFTHFKLALVNQVNGQMTKTKETMHGFKPREPHWGFHQFIPLGELCDAGSGFIMNDVCVIEAQIFFSIDQEVSKIDDGEPASSDIQLPKEISFGDLVEFRNFGKIERAFDPLLDEVCSWHPSLIECQQKRSREFTHWAFTALGRVLHFLNTKKGKDMNDDACSHLQMLWEELEICKFDLAWLQPHIKSALGMNNYTEKAMQVKTMKEKVAVFDKKVKRLKQELVAAEKDLEIATRDFVKEEEGFEERDMDAELGYGEPLS